LKRDSLLKSIRKEFSNFYPIEPGDVSLVPFLAGVFSLDPKGACWDSFDFSKSHRKNKYDPRLLMAIESKYF
jgi:hypothetical protein